MFVMPGSVAMREADYGQDAPELVSLTTPCSSYTVASYYDSSFLKDHRAPTNLSGCRILAFAMYPKGLLFALSSKWNFYSL
jgi:soluble lytic murein transglycosylase-like protein